LEGQRGRGGRSPGWFAGRRTRRRGWLRRTHPVRTRAAGGPRRARRVPQRRGHPPRTAVRGEAVGGQARRIVVVAYAVGCSSRGSYCLACRSGGRCTSSRDRRRHTSAFASRPGCGHHWDGPAVPSVDSVGATLEPGVPFVGASKRLFIGTRFLKTLLGGALRRRSRAMRLCSQRFASILKN
jgi:hypothetical protein